MVGYSGSCVGRQCVWVYVPGERKLRGLWVGWSFFSHQTLERELAYGFPGLSAHLAEAWAAVGHSATLWGHKEESVASRGSRSLERKSHSDAAERPGGHRGHTTPGA